MLQSINQYLYCKLKTVNHNILYTAKNRVLNFPQGSYKFYVGRPAGSHLSKLVATPDIDLHGQYHVSQMPPYSDRETLVDRNTRGHSTKLWKGRRLNCQRINFFRHRRVVNRLNMLSENIVTLPSINNFKNHYLRCLLSCSQI